MYIILNETPSIEHTAFRLGNAGRHRDFSPYKTSTAPFAYHSPLASRVPRCQPCGSAHSVNCRVRALVAVTTTITGSTNVPSQRSAAHKRAGHDSARELSVEGVFVCACDCGNVY